MEVVTRASPLYNICEGCLTRDRILAIITNDEIKEVYNSIISEKLHAKGPLLCWECVANIQRYLSFKRQCTAAHQTLIKYMVSSTKISSLSKLSINKNVYEIQIPYEDKPSTIYRTDGNAIKTFSENFAMQELPIEFEHKKEIQDISFIKIEDDGMLNDAIYLDDGLSQNDFNDVDYKDNKIESKRNKNIEDEFNPSDEEPLTRKKRKKIVKEGKDKKKTDVPASHNGTKKLFRREKPAGVVNNSRVTKKLQQLNVPEGQIEMVLLSWEEVEQERQAALTNVIFTRHDYRCYDCVIGFNHRSKLENHMKKHQPSPGDVVCDVCNVRCKDAHALGGHRSRHRVRWRCTSCGGRWSRAAVCADHVSRAHAAAAPTHACARCGRHEPTLAKLRNHLKNHAERQKCELCGKTFRDRMSLRTHLFIHKGEKEYSCPQCDKKFLFKKAMEVHLVTHDASAQLYCYQCDQNFKNRMSYTQHMKYSLKHIDPSKLKFACGLCDKKFAKSARLNEHHLAVHLKATPVQCTVHGCDFACSSRPVLRTHMRMVHRNGKAVRNHVCDTCGKTYTTKKCLEGHIRSHTGERPFKCNLCPSTFGYEAALYNHNKLVHLKAKINRRPAQPLTVKVTAGPANIT